MDKFRPKNKSGENTNGNNNTNLKQHFEDYKECHGLGDDGTEELMIAGNHGYQCLFGCLLHEVGSFTFDK